MPCYLYVGPVGSGKTYCAWAHAVSDRGKTIWHNLVDKQADESVAGYRRLWWPWLGLGFDRKPRKLVFWDDFNDEFAQSHCGVILGDEIHLWLDARKWDEMNPSARRKISEHRKDDLRLIFTAQHVSFVDRVYRILCDEVRVVSEWSVPFIGWFYWPCRRKSLFCPKCGERMTRGDDSLIKKILGFGTFYFWRVWPPAVLGAMDEATDKSLMEQKSKKLKPRGIGIRLFRQHVADTYATYSKLSTAAAQALSRRGKRAAKKTLAPPDPAYAAGQLALPGNDEPPHICPLPPQD